MPGSEVQPRQAGWAERLRSREDQLTIVLSLVIGVIVGLVVVAFILLTGRLAARMYPAGRRGVATRADPDRWARSSPAICLFRYFPNARGSGIPQTKFALFINDGYISLRTVFGKFFAARFRSRAASRSDAKDRRCRSARASLRSLGRRFGLEHRERESAGSGGMLGRAGRGVQHSDRRRAVFARGDPRRSARAGARFGGAQFGDVVDGSASGPRRSAAVSRSRLSTCASRWSSAIYAILGVVGGLGSVCFREAAAESARWFQAAAKVDGLDPTRCRRIAGGPDRMVQCPKCWASATTMWTACWAAISR